MPSINTLQFTKFWKKPIGASGTEFPTVETDEGQVRADMQELFDQIQTYLNNTVVSAINALVTGTGINFYNSVSDFPAAGSASNLYVAKDENKVYRWDDTTSTYVAVGGGSSGSYLPLSGGTLTGLVTGPAYKVVGSASTALALTTAGDYIGLYDTTRQTWVVKAKISDPSETVQFLGTATNCTNANKVTVSSSAPQSPKTGDIWVVTE